MDIYELFDLLADKYNKPYSNIALYKHLQGFKYILLQLPKLTNEDIRILASLIDEFEIEIMATDKVSIMIRKKG